MLSQPIKAYRDLLNEAYQEYIQKYYSYLNDEEYACLYSLFDMDSNGISELIIEKGNCEENSVYHI